MKKPSFTHWCGAALLVLLSGCLGGGGGGSSSGDRQPPAPAQEVAAYVEAVGLGVSDLDTAVAFYQSGLGMHELHRLERDDRIEVVMESADRRGAQVQLMAFTDGLGRVYQQNPGKLVFYVRDIDAFTEQFENAGGRITLPPTAVPGADGTVVSFGRDPENTLIEMIQVPSVSNSFIAGVGIGVSDLSRFRDFYGTALKLQAQDLLQVPEQYDEYSLLSPIPGSSALILVHWTDGSTQNYTDNPVKLQLGTADPVRLAEQLEQAGAALLASPAPSTEADLEGEVLGYAADPDGTLLEIRQSIRAGLVAGGIGVEDLATAVPFYTDGLGMRVVERRSREDRDEVVLESADGRGSHVVLMEFTDGLSRNLDRNPGKLVFYVRDIDAFVTDFVAAGGRLTLPPMADPGLGVTVAFGRDLHNNLIEMVSDATAEHSYFGAFGIGVSDLEEARRFWVEELGFRQLMYLPIPGMYDEYILQGYDGSALVLMHWTNGGGQNYRDNPVKLEIHSIAPGPFTEAVARAGGELVQEPTSDPTLNDQMVGYARDADGSLLEVRQAPWGLD